MTADQHQAHTDPRPLTPAERRDAERRQTIRKLIAETRSKLRHPSTLEDHP